MPPVSPIVMTASPRGSVLVLAPHPDDESLGCGGAIVLHSRQGDRVTVLFATDGTAGDPLGHYKHTDYRQVRRAEARKAGEILGVHDLTFWAYHDGRLAEAGDLADRLAGLLDAKRPDIIYCPSVREPHPDHSALAAAISVTLAHYRKPLGVYTYEIWATGQPTHVLDITAVWQVKQKAIEQYQSQLMYNDYLHKISGLNAYRAIYVPSARYVEAFEAG